MNKKFTVLLAILLITFLSFAYSRLATASTVFSDDFTTGDFAKWSETYVSSGSSQTVSNGIARFTVPMPPAGARTFSFVRTEGFVSTANSTIIATQNVYFSKIPNGCPQGNGAIFFLYVCDYLDISGNNGNFGVGIDGSGVWSLWIGGSLTYNYVFQTEGAFPISNTWYHVVLMIDNSAGKAALTINGATVISSSQKQFTDGINYVSLMSGIGENWWSDGAEQQEVAVANVVLEISDAVFQPPPISTYLPAHPLPTKKVTPDPSPAVPTGSSNVDDPPVSPDISELPALIVVLLVIAATCVCILSKKIKR